MAALSEGYANEPFALIKAKSQSRVFTSPQFTFSIGDNNIKVTVHAAAIAKLSQALDVLINDSWMKLLIFQNHISSLIQLKS